MGGGSWIGGRRFTSARRSTAIQVGPYAAYLLMFPIVIVGLTALPVPLQLALLALHVAGFVRLYMLRAEPLFLAGWAALALFILAQRPQKLTRPAHLR